MSFTKITYAEWERNHDETRRNRNKFTATRYNIFNASRYHINKMDITKLMPVKGFMSITNFSWLRILFYKGKPLQIVDQLMALFKETKGKNLEFYFKKNGKTKQQG